MPTTMLTAYTDAEGWVRFSARRLPNGTTVTTWKRDGCTRTSLSGPLPKIPNPARWGDLHT